MQPLGTSSWPKLLPGSLRGHLGHSGWDLVHLVRHLAPKKVPKWSQNVPKFDPKIDKNVDEILITKFYTFGIENGLKFHQFSTLADPPK